MCVADVRAEEGIAECAGLKTKYDLDKALAAVRGTYLEIGPVTWKDTVKLYRMHRLCARRPKRRSSGCACSWPSTNGPSSQHKPGVKMHKINTNPGSS